MILSGLDIQKNLGSKIVIEPFHTEQLNPNSYNLRLHNEIMQQFFCKSRSLVGAS